MNIGLKLGARGANVERLHRVLISEGHDIEHGEIERREFGRSTIEALRALQHQRGLRTADTEIDEPTFAVLFEIEQGTPPTPPKPDEHQGRVQGKLVNEDGTPIPDTRVSLFSKQLRSETHLGNATTNKKSQYTIGYHRQSALNLIVRAYDATGKVIAESATLYAAAAEVEIDFTTAKDRVVKSPSRFTTIETEVAAQLQGAPLEDLKENKDTHELRFLASSIGTPFNDVAYLFIAHKLGIQDKLLDSTLFGIFYQSIPASLDAALASLPDAGIDDTFTMQVMSGVLAHSRTSLSSALTTAIASNILPASFADTQDRELTILDDLRIQSVGSTAYIRGKTSLNDLLAAGAVADAVKTGFAKAYAESGGRLGPTWKALRANKNLSKADLATLNTTLSAGELLGGNIPLVKDTLQRISQKTLAGVRDLALLDENDWAARIAALDPQATSIPSVLKDDTPPQRIGRFAKALAERFASRYPTTAFVRGLTKAKTSSFATKTELISVLGAHPAFNFKRSNIDQYIATNKVTISAPALAEFKMAQRLFRISPHYTTVEALKSAGYQSAQSVYLKGHDPFMAHMTQALGSASLANAAYARAQTTYATALMAFGRFHLSLNGIGFAVTASPVPDPSKIANLPDLQALFGSLDYCQCTDCRSIYSPAAYLVDLLQFLKQRAATGAFPHALDVLLARRSDLQYIALDCNNTNVTLPYIDLVNEILEAVISPPSAPLTVIDTKGTSAERRALPQQISQAAYTLTASHVFPLSLPFDLPFAQTSAYLSALGESRGYIMALFRGAPGEPNDAAIAGANLGVNPEMQAVINGTDAHQPWDRWGLPQNPNPGTVLDPKTREPYSQALGDWTGVLGKVPVLLNRANLSLQQLCQLLEVKWVTVSGVTLQPGFTSTNGVQLLSCDTDLMTFTGLTGEVLDRANRFLRLWTATRLQMWELDWALDQAAGGLLNDSFLIFLSGASAVQTQLNLPFQEVLSFWGPIETRDITNHLGDQDAVVPSTYSEVFRNPTMLSSWSTIFVAAGSLSGASIILPTLPPPTPAQSANVNAITAALALSADDISAILTFTGAANTLSLDTLNVLLRFARLASSQSLNIPDLILWIQLTAATPFGGTPADTLEFLRRLAVLKGTGIAVHDLDYLLRDQSASQSSLTLTTSQATTVLQGFRDALAKLVPTSQIAITAASNMSPIAVSTALPHGLQTGMQVAISGVLGNTAANGIFTISVTSPTAFTLNGSSGNGEWTSGGIVTANIGITAASNASPIAINTASPHGLQTGAQVSISGVLGNTAANGRFTITVTSPTAFILNGSSGNGAWTSGGVVTANVALAIETISVQALATATSVTANVVTPVLLKTGVLPLSSNMISLLLAQTSGIDPAQFSQLVNAFTSVAKAAALFTALQATETAFAFLVRNAATFNWLDPSALPLTPTPTSPYVAFETLLQALKIDQRQPARSPKMFEVLGQWLSVMPPDLATAINGRGANFAVTAVSNTSPVAITTASPHGLQAGTQVSISGILGNTAANGTFTISVISSTAFFLNGSSGNGAWTSGGIVTATPVPSLSLALNASVADVTAIVTALNAQPPNVDPTKRTGSLCDIAMLTSIANALDTVARYSISGATLVQLSVAPPTAGTAAAAMGAFQAQYKQSAWFAAVQPVEDALRQNRRDALVAYILGQGPAVPIAPQMLTTDDIFNYYLIDPEMCACGITTRLLQASLTIQQFVQQCFLNLVSQVNVDAIADSGWNEWSTKQQFRLRQANLQVLLYPENYLLPELRTDKSPFFSDLEKDLRQSNCDAAAVTRAYENYLRKLVDVSRPVVSAHYHETRRDGSRVLHVFAHTRGTPPKWYYRNRAEGQDGTGIWSAWQSLNLDIASDQLMPVIWDQRLHLVWPVFKRVPEKQGNQPVPSQGGGSSSAPARKFWTVEFAMSEFSAGQWQAKRTITEKMFVRLFDIGQPDSPLAFTFRASPDSTFNLQLQTYYTGEFVTFSSTTTTIGGTTSTSSVTVINSVTATMIANGTLATPDAPLSVTEYSFIFPSSELVDLSQEPTYSLVTSTDNLVGQLGTPTGYGFSGQDLIYGNYWSANPGAVPLYVLCETTAKGQPSNVELLSSIVNPHIIIPQQEAVFDSSDPFFVADPSRVYFVQPHYYTLSSSPKELDNLSYISQWSTKYSFAPFYHPFARTFLRELEIGGIDQLMRRHLQLNPEQVRGWQLFHFPTLYQPQPPVAQPYPVEDVNFDPDSAYSLYNWELFYHVPMFVASLLMQNQQYQDAMKWLEYIFNPTDSSSTPVPGHFWQTKPFYNMNATDWLNQQIQNILTTLAADTQQGISDPATAAAVQDWIANPFDPHKVASLRIGAYGKAAVMKFLDNLIALGDSLYSGYTMEKVTQAEQLYVFADLILGPQPDQIRLPERYQATDANTMTYATIQSSLDQMSNALVQIENIVVAPNLPLQQSEAVAKAPMLPQIAMGTVETLFFCIPPNDQLLAYWRTVADRLYKIRHCLNLQGVAQPLPLYAPPINPLQLIEEQAGGAGAIGGQTFTPVYRFATYLQRAIERTNDVRAYGALILSALEKKDAEALAVIRANQDLNIQTLMLDVKTQQVTEAQDQITALKNQQAVVQIRYNFYSTIAFMNTWETTAMSLQGAALIANGLAVVLDMTSGAAHLTPKVTAGAAGFGGSPAMTVTIGGENVGHSATSFANVARNLAGILSESGGLAATMGGYQRRMDEWNLQAQLANAELTQVASQITAATDRLNIANNELSIQNQQIANSQTVSDFLTNKYTNEQLYDWMLTQLTTVHTQAYQLTFGSAQQAGTAFQYELGSQETFIQFGYWDSQYKGLTAGESLLFDLRRMEAQYLAENTRELELTKHVSFALTQPLALVQLLETGTCQLNLDEALFDADHPGHYFRRLRSVALTIPCVTGPYTGVNATLILNTATVRVQPPLSPYQPATAASPPSTASFLSSPAPATATIGTSSGQNDAGLFDVNLRDERWLPFEGQGAISSWTLVLDPRDNNFDFSTITDVVLHIRYTARSSGGDPEAVRKALKPTSARSILVSVRGTYGDAYYSFFNPTDTTATQQTLRLPITKAVFPFSNLGSPKIAEIAIHMVLAQPPALGTTIGATFGPTSGTANALSLAAVPGMTNAGNPVAFLSGDAALANPVAPESFTLIVPQASVPPSLSAKINGQVRLDSTKIEDIVLIINYTIT